MTPEMPQSNAGAYNYTQGKRRTWERNGKGGYRHKVVWKGRGGGRGFADMACCRFARGREHKGYARPNDEHMPLPPSPPSRLLGRHRREQSDGYAHAFHDGSATKV